ncbi:MAG: hypothetical protein LBS72_02435 [Oscillospiraceae bacterium]|jgi:hypothetical protein|nr:hypothetical protein [Oscillospiraceae bacterium]
MSGTFFFQDTLGIRKLQGITRACSKNISRLNMLGFIKLSAGRGSAASHPGNSPEESAASLCRLRVRPSPVAD